MILVWSSFHLVLTFLLLPDNSLAGPEIIGTPPSFTQQPEDTVVHETVFHDFNGSMVNLVLRCGVTGDPAPTVTWFRGNINITGEGLTPGDGSIGLNVTEGEAGGAARTGTLYHCRATNTIGLNNVSVTIRSRTVNVSYAFFDGFRDSPGPVTVSTRAASSVALECAVNASNPPPEIRWMRRVNSGSLEDVMLTTVNQGSFVESVQGGRYLYFSAVMGPDITNMEYTCVVTNAIAVSSQPVPSNRFYTIDFNLPDNELVIFISFNGTREVSIGETFIVYNSAAYGTNDISMAFNALCFAQGSGGQAELQGVSTRRTYTVPDPPIHDYITCTGAAGGSTRFTHRLNLIFVRPPMIATSMPPVELVRRDIISGGPAVVLTCENNGIPDPVVTWFYNGVPLSGTSNGATVNNEQVTIGSPQPSNSGIYQCFVANGVSAPLSDTHRSYVVEVTDPVAPMFTDLVNTNNLSVADRIEGTLLVQPSDSMDVTITARVTSNPCPSVQWLFNGTNITTGDPLFSFNDPCVNDANFSPYLFNLTITNLTLATSGVYSAIFDNQGFSSPRQMPPLYVTIPVPSEALRVSVEIRGKPGISCLLANSTAIFTCDLIGFPRPTVEFFFGNDRIDPLTKSRITNISFDQIEIVNIENTDQGSYNCRVNSASSAPTATSFSFCSLPVIVNLTSTPNIVEGSNLEIVCFVDGSPIPTVVWFKDGVRIQSQGENIRISTTEDDKSSIVFINSASPSNNGIYTCMATNDAGSVNRTIEIQVRENDTGPLTTAAIIGISAAAAGFFLILVLLILLLICVFLCAKRSSKSQSVDFHPYNVDSTPADDYKDGRGNVDADSVDGNVPPEAFEPDYASLPTMRPNEPPPYKAAPGYGHGGPLDGDDLEMVKYPPQDSESYLGYARQQDQYRPTPDDFLSEDAQFV